MMIEQLSETANMLKYAKNPIQCNCASQQRFMHLYKKYANQGRDLPKCRPRAHSDTPPPYFTHYSREKMRILLLFQFQFHYQY